MLLVYSRYTASHITVVFMWRWRIILSLRQEKEERKLKRLVRAAAMLLPVR